MNRPILKGNGLTLLCIIGVLTCQALSLTMECYNKCGGTREWYQVLYEGSAICYFTPDMPSGKIMLSKCMLDCEGLTPPAPEDVTRCFCELCKGKDPGSTYSYKDFCKEPGTKTQIAEEECEKVCAGNDDIKYRNTHCYRET